MENRISIDIPEDVAANFLAKLDEASAIIAPYLSSVTDDQKKNLLKLGDKTVPFVNKALEYAQTNGKEYVLAYLDSAEFSKDVNSSNQLVKLYKGTEQLANMIDDTHALTANDAYAAALAYYNVVKSAAKAGESKAKTIYDDLSQRFPGRGTGTKTANTTTTEK